MDIVVNIIIDKKEARDLIAKLDELKDEGLFEKLQAVVKSAFPLDSGTGCFPMPPYADEEFHNKNLKKKRRK